MLRKNKTRKIFIIDVGSFHLHNGSLIKANFVEIVAFENYFNSIVEWSGRHSTPAGSEERLRPHRRSRGGSASSPAHRVSEAQ